MISRTRRFLQTSYNVFANCFGPASVKQQTLLAIDRFSLPQMTSTERSNVFFNPSLPFQTYCTKIDPSSFSLDIILRSTACEDDSIASTVQAGSRRWYSSRNPQRSFVAITLPSHPGHWCFFWSEWSAFHGTRAGLSFVLHNNTIPPGPWSSSTIGRLPGVARVVKVAPFEASCFGGGPLCYSLDCIPLRAYIRLVEGTEPMAAVAGWKICFTCTTGATCYTCSGTGRYFSGCFCFFARKFGGSLFY